MVSVIDAHMDRHSLLAYHHALWRRFGEYYVKECTWEDLSKDHETSHHTIANVTMHAVNMEDWWLHSLVPGKPWAGPKWDGFRDADSMRARIIEVENKTNAYLDGLSPKERATPRRIDSEGVTGTWTLDEIIAEVINEATHHRGEVLAMLWRMDKEPPYVSYLQWLDEQRQSK